MRNLALVFIFLVTSLLSLTMFVGVEKINTRPILKTTHPHLYGNDTVPIDIISLTVFYFVPKDAVAKKQDNWKEITEEHLKKLLAFHDIQFEKTSTINYTFFPEIIVGDKTTEQYESLFKRDDDHDALIPVKEEISRRVLDTTGDLHAKLENNPNLSARKVYLVVFEGNGGAGNDTFALVSRSYLTDPLYKENGTTFLAHEFYHTLGLLDNYTTSIVSYSEKEQKTISLVTNKDIMGQVNVPLSHTYIDPETLRKMGL